MGDHIIKVNGARPTDHKHAMRLIDTAWSQEATDASKDRLKFSLADRTEDIQLRREAAGSDAPRGAAPAPDTGLTLIDNTTNGLGVVVLHVAEARPAHVAGLQVGHVIMACDGRLCWDHKSTLRQMTSALASKGEVDLVVQLRKLTEGNVLNQRIGEIPINVVVSS